MRKCVYAYRQAVGILFDKNNKDSVALFNSSILINIEACSLCLQVYSKV